MAPARAVVAAFAGGLAVLTAMAMPAQAAAPVPLASNPIWPLLLAMLTALAASVAAVAAQRQAMQAGQRQARAEDKRLRDFGADLTGAVREMVAFTAMQATAAEECREHAARANAAANRIVASIIDAEARLARASQRAEQGLAAGSDAVLTAGQGLAPLAALARELPESVAAAINASADGAGAALTTRLDACAERLEAAAADAGSVSISAPAPSRGENPIDPEPALQRLEALSRLLDLFSSALPDPAALAASVAAASAAMNRLELVAIAVPACVDTLSETSGALRKQAAYTGQVAAEASTQIESLSGIATAMARQAAAWPELTTALQTALTLREAEPVEPKPEAGISAPLIDLLAETSATAEALREDLATRRAQITQEQGATERLHRAALLAEEAAARVERTTSLLPQHMAELGHATGTIGTILAGSVAAMRQDIADCVEAGRRHEEAALALPLAAVNAAHAQLQEAANALNATAFARLHDIDIRTVEWSGSVSEQSNALLVSLHGSAVDAINRVADAGAFAQMPVGDRPGLEETTLQLRLSTEQLHQALEGQTRVLLQTERLLATLEARGTSTPDRALAAAMHAELSQLHDHFDRIALDRPAFAGTDPTLTAAVSAIGESVQHVQGILAQVVTAGTARDHADQNLERALQDVIAALRAEPAHSLSLPADTMSLVAHTGTAASALLVAAETSALKAESEAQQGSNIEFTPFLLRDIDATIRKLQSAATAVALASDKALMNTSCKAA